MVSKRGSLLTPLEEDNNKSIPNSEISVAVKTYVGSPLQFFDGGGVFDVGQIQCIFDIITSMIQANSFYGSANDMDVDMKRSFYRRLLSRVLCRIALDADLCISILCMVEVY